MRSLTLMKKQPISPPPSHSNCHNQVPSGKTISHLRSKYFTFFILHNWGLKQWLKLPAIFKVLRWPIKEEGKLGEAKLAPHGAVAPPRWLTASRPTVPPRSLQPERSFLQATGFWKYERGNRCGGRLIPCARSTRQLFSLMARQRIQLAETITRRHIQTLTNVRCFLAGRYRSVFTADLKSENLTFAVKLWLFGCHLK